MGDDFTRLRHGLRTPVNHIIGYCEMLIEGGDEPGGRGRLAGLNSILARGKEVLGVLESAPRGSRAVSDAWRLAELRDRLSTPLGRIVEECDGLRATMACGEDGQSVRDLARIRGAAVRLMEMADAMIGDPAGTDESRGH